MGICLIGSKMHQSKEKFQEWVEYKVFERSWPYEVERRGRKMKEVHSSSFGFHQDEYPWLNEFRQHEYDQYLEMITPQLPRFKRYFELDKFSRRLLIQFPANWYEDKEQDYMPCPESFMVQFLEEDEYIVQANFRSSEVSRIVEDVSIIKKFCEDVLELKQYKMLWIDCHFNNAHKYLDGGSSEDFTAKTYFEKK